MKKAIAAIIGLLVILPITHAIVVAVAEAQGKPLPKKYFYPAWILTTLLVVGLLVALPKCSTDEQIAPNGKTNTEHYEPRY